MTMSIHLDHQNTRAREAYLQDMGATLASGLFSIPSNMFGLLLPHLTKRNGYFRKSRAHFWL